MAREPRRRTSDSNRPAFSVDTHLFRELGELLVGRDSTALVELIKNAYDADAGTVTVYGERLREPGGFIVLTDDGVGMSPEEFRRGFLRVAGRTKETGNRRSRRFGRRFTGEKGIGRLAAHKLSSELAVHTIPWSPHGAPKSQRTDARIDWDEVESHETLDDVGDAVSVQNHSVDKGAPSGTEIRLGRLRRQWTEVDLAEFLAEAEGVDPPEMLAGPLPKELLGRRLLFDVPEVRDVAKASHDPGFEVRFEGDFEELGEWWDSIAETTEWVAEVRARKDGIRFAVAPSRRELERRPTAEPATHRLEHPDPKHGPFFDIRVLMRGRRRGTAGFRAWSEKVAGVRVYMEGFRVLPYGEQANDWLGIARDVTLRRRTLASLAGVDEFTLPDEDPDAALVLAPPDSYIGAVFLTHESAATLQMLVNREGFLPNSALEIVQLNARRAVDLVTRSAAAARLEERTERKKRRRSNAGTTDAAPAAVEQRERLRASVDRALTLAAATRRTLAIGDSDTAAADLALLEDELRALTDQLTSFVNEDRMLPVLASVGIQMAEFVHEVNGLLGLAQAADRALEKVRQVQPSGPGRNRLAEGHRVVRDLRMRLERQAAYLMDVLSAGSRRRRSRQRLADRFDAACRLVTRQAEERGIRVRNEIPTDLRSPPMFPAELTAVFANLLTNAIKAAGEGGRVVATGELRDDDRTVVRIENTGIRVSPKDRERWFAPFESTTMAVDPVLGQGMGLGLPITRAVLDEYRAAIQFVDPSPPMSTAIEIDFGEAT